MPLRDMLTELTLLVVGPCHRSSAWRNGERDSCRVAAAGLRPATDLGGYTTRRLTPIGKGLPIRSQPCVPDELAGSGVWSTARTHRRLSAKCPQLSRAVGARRRCGVEAASLRPVAVSGSQQPHGPARPDPVPGGGPSSFLVRAARGGFNRSMGDKTIIKVDSTHSPHGPLGQLYLATGVGVGMRLWRDRPPGPPMPEVARDYETVGYVISGRAELHSEGQMVLLEPGNAWVVPRHARHTYKILEPFTAVEATHPPAEIHDRDRPVGQGNRSDAERDSG